MSAILSETVVSLTDIAKRAPSGRGAGPSRAAHRTTVMRWVVKGVRVGERLVKLEAVRIGGHWATSVEAYERFVAACTGGAVPEVLDRTPAQQNRAHERAMRDIEARRKRTAGQK